MHFPPSEPPLRRIWKWKWLQQISLFTLFTITMFMETD